VSLTTVPAKVPAKKAVILVSGGLDSTTVLAIAQRSGYECYTLSFDYGQRHRAELTAAAVISKTIGAIEHKTIVLDLGAIGGSALTDESIAVPEQICNGIPITYVPARNTVFLSIALGWAEVLAAEDIFIGVNAVDYSGYPDCRPNYISAYEAMANLATKAGVEGHRLCIRTPLINLTKADIIRRGVELGLDYSLTVSCYQATIEGLACGVCDSCRFRQKGFNDADIVDSTRYIK